MNWDIVFEWIVTGKATTWAFKNIIGTGFDVINNNFLFLWMMAKAWKRYAATTENKWDDKWSTKFYNFLAKFRSDKKEKPNG